jgi:CRP-like cAMP-binding protein
VTDYALLRSLAPDERQRVLAAARRRIFARDDVIFWAGDPGDAVHLLKSGHVAVQVTTPRGDVATVRILGPGEHFGELALVAPAPRAATMRALDAVETLVVSHADFEVLRRDPAIEQSFVEALASEIRRMSGVLTDALYLPARDVLWKRLAGIEAVFATGADETELPLTQSTIASVAGVSRQTASKFFDAAESSGVIRRDAKGRVTVVDRPALHARADSR